MLGRNTFANAYFSNDNNGRIGVIRKSIAGIITLLGAFATAHSAFADAVNFSSTQVYAAAALPLVATGLGALGLLSWRKRNAGAIDRSRAPYVSFDKLEALLTKKSVDIYVTCERWLGRNR
jgi:hypothetical protein